MASDRKKSVAQLQTEMAYYARQLSVSRSNERKNRAVRRLEALRQELMRRPAAAERRP